MVDALGLERAIAYGVERNEETHRLTLAESTGFAPGVVRKEMGAVVAATPGRWGFFNPLKPEPAQRNRAFALKINEWGLEPAGSREELGTSTLDRNSPIFDAFRGMGIAVGESQLRVLVCEGEALLAWVGGFRAKPFTQRDGRLLQALTPALQRRLSLDQLLESGPWLRGGLAAALEEVSSAAFIVDGSGSVKYANALGKARHDQRPSSVRRELRDAIASEAGAFRKTPVGCTSRPHWLLVATCDQSLEGRLSSATRHWALTARQGEVLSALVQGHANKAIAVQLDCAVRTVEQHVTAIFEKAGVDTRASLAAKFWKST